MLLHFSLAVFNSDDRELQNCITATCTKLFKPSEPVAMYFSASYFVNDVREVPKHVNYFAGINISAPPEFDKCNIKEAEIVAWYIKSGNFKETFLVSVKNYKNHILRHGYETGEIVDFEKQVLRNLHDANIWPITMHQNTDYIVQNVIIFVKYENIENIDRLMREMLNRRAKFLVILLGKE